MFFFIVGDYLKCRMSFETVLRAKVGFIIRIDVLVCYGSVSYKRRYCFIMGVVLIRNSFYTIQKQKLLSFRTFVTGFVENFF